MFKIDKSTIGARRFLPIPTLSYPTYTIPLQVTYKIGTLTRFLTYKFTLDIRRTLVFSRRHLDVPPLATNVDQFGRVLSPPTGDVQTAPLYCRFVRFYRVGGEIRIALFLCFATPCGIVQSCGVRNLKGFFKKGLDRGNCNNGGLIDPKSKREGGQDRRKPVSFREASDRKYSVNLEQISGTISPTYASSPPPSAFLRTTVFHELTQVVILVQISGTVSYELTQVLLLPLPAFLLFIRVHFRIVE
jgi:hypothetical protein